MLSCIFGNDKFYIVYGGNTIFINKITIRNVKGKACWENKFDGLCSNKVNLFVAPNGYGKSTITTAFHAAAHGKMKLDKHDYFEDDDANEPSIELEYTTDNEKKIVVTDLENSELSKEFTIFTINNPLYAKATGRNMGSYATRTAEMFIEEIEVCDVPQRCIIEYRFKDMRGKLGKRIKNLSKFLSSEDGLEFILSNREYFDKCIKQKRLSSFLDDIISKKESPELEALSKYPIIKMIVDKLSKDFSLNYKAAIDYLIQIVELLKSEGIKKFQKSFAWVKYQNNKMLIDKRLAEFNTTGLKLHSSNHSNKVVIKFGRAGRMSNGERDILCFVASLFVFESKLDKKPGILIIDEVFDYLDGTNLLAAQYYLSQLIMRVKKAEKLVFPIIMTHLDPAVFANYNFKKMAVHYLDNKSKIDLQDKVVKLLILRSDLKKNDDPNIGELEKHLLHYYSSNWTIPEEIKVKISDDFWQDSDSFRAYLYSEVNHYIDGLDYNPLAVIIGLRVKIEEKTVQSLPKDAKEEYYKKRGSKHKLEFAEEYNADLPELFYLLQPLYNDPAHLRSGGGGAETENRNKIKSAYLKLSSAVVKKMIKDVFSMR